MMTETTLIKKADWVIAWDPAAKNHGYLRHADVAFQGNTITHVGKDFNGPWDHRIEGAGLCVMPGLVNVHAHPYAETAYKGFVEDGLSGQRGEYQWFNDIFSYRPDQHDQAVCAEVGFSELLLSGVTTLVDISLPYPGWFELAERSGLRMYLAPMYTSTSGMWQVDSGHEIDYAWEADGGKAQFARALAIVDQAITSNCGRLSGMIMPAQVDTCSPDLLRDSLAAARERAVPLQIHAAQLVAEFQEITRRHGVTPISLLAQHGILGPETIVSHAIFLDHHPWMHFWGTNDDLSIFADSGASAAHSPTIFARAGIALQDFGRYQAAGINIGMGTDSFPHNMLEEMRLALMIARVVSGRIERVTTADIFKAATISGAQALDRTDIGRLTPGAKADLVLVDLSHPAMKPMRDPLRSLIFQAADRAVRDVFVDGVKVVGDSRVLTLEYSAASRQIDEVKRRMEAKAQELDWAGRMAQELSPLSLGIMDDPAANTRKGDSA